MTKVRTTLLSRKLTWVMAAGLFLTSLSLSAQNQADRILGVYLTAQKDGKIEIYKQGNRYFGKLIWGKDTHHPDGSPKLDIKNEDPKLRKQPILGMVLMRDLEYEDQQWVNGRVYDPNNGKTYRCKLSFEGEKLQIRGYLGISMFGRTEVWERVKH